MERAFYGIFGIWVLFDKVGEVGVLEYESC